MNKIKMIVLLIILASIFFIDIGFGRIEHDYFSPTQEWSELSTYDENKTETVEEEDNEKEVSEEKINDNRNKTIIKNVLYTIIKISEIVLIILISNILLTKYINKDKKKIIKENTLYELIYQIICITFIIIINNTPLNLLIYYIVGLILLISRYLFSNYQNKKYKINNSNNLIFLSLISTIIYLIVPFIPTIQ